MTDELEVERDGARLKLTFRGKEPAPASAAACEHAIREIEAAKPRMIQVLCDFAIPGDGWVAATRGKSIPSVRAIAFDVFFTHAYLQTANGNTLGDLGDAWTAFPNLERAFMAGELAMRANTTHPKLVELHLAAEPMSEACVAGLGQTVFPALERCAVMSSTRVAPALKSMNAPQLREVCVVGRSFFTSVMALAEGGVPPSWRRCTIKLPQPPLEDELDEDLPALAAAWGALGEVELAVALEDWPKRAAKLLRGAIKTARDCDDWGRNAGNPRTYRAW
jgi:hypothetical protein